MEDNTDNPFASRTHAFTSLTAAVDNAFSTDSLDTFVKSTSLTSTWDGTKNNGVVGYIVVWVDGQASGSDTYDGNAALNTALTVTVQKATA